MERNKLDIELYEWAKGIALVNCPEQPSPADEPNQADSADEEDDNEEDDDGEGSEDDDDEEESVAHSIGDASEMGPMTDVIESSSGIAYASTHRIAQQVNRYQEGSGLIINVHVTHHAGTSVCHAIGRAPGTDGAPRFACMGVKPEDNVTINNYPEYRPWMSRETAANIRLVRQFFHMISWEFSRPPLTPLAETDWENPDLVSMIVLRDPISRLLAGDAFKSRNYPSVAKGNASKEEWMSFARDEILTNNYALHILAGKGCCQGQDTDLRHLETAKSFLRRMTFVLDIACLDAGMNAIADILGFSLNTRRLDELSEWRELKSHVHLPSSERIPYPEVYQYLLARNKLDIELYEWSKRLAVVNCSDI